MPVNRGTPPNSKILEKDFYLPEPIQPVKGNNAEKPGVPKWKESRFQTISLTPSGRQEAFPWIRKNDAPVSKKSAFPIQSVDR
jgi:hypothetical protein